MAAPVGAPAQTSGDSQANRAQKTIVVTLQPIGFGPIPAFSSGFTVGYFQSPDLILQLEATSGFRLNYTSSAQKDENGYGSSTSSIAWTSEFQAVAVGAHAKYFVGNSFYVKGGLDYRSVRQADIHTNVGNSASSYTIEFTGQALSAALALGNQWQFSYFTLGIDWIGAVLPFTSKVSETNPANSTDYGRQLSREGQQNYLKSLSGLFGRFYLGASF